LVMLHNPIMKKKVLVLAHNNQIWISPPQVHIKVVVLKLDDPTF